MEDGCVGGLWLASSLLLMYAVPLSAIIVVLFFVPHGTRFSPRKGKR